MHRALTVVFLIASCGFARASDSRTPGRATEAYHQRLFEIINSTPALAREKLTAYGGAAIHFSFRIDTSGRISRLRVFAERASDRPAAQVLARVVRTTHFPPPPPQVIAEQRHNWYDFPELVFMPGAD